jgi:hypothetical protein
MIEGPDPYLVLSDPDVGGPKTYGPGSATLFSRFFDFSSPFYSVFGPYFQSFSITFYLFLRKYDVLTPQDISAP